MRIVVYDPRSLATIWVLDEITGDYIAVPYRVPHPDMTLAESEEARRRLLALKAATTARRKAERTRQARRGAEEAAIRLPGPAAPPVPALDDVQPGPSQTTDAPARAVVIEPFTDVAGL